MSLCVCKNDYHRRIRRVFLQCLLSLALVVVVIGFVLFVCIYGSIWFSPPLFKWINQTLCDFRQNQYRVDGNWWYAAVALEHTEHLLCDMRLNRMWGHILLLASPLSLAYENSTTQIQPPMCMDNEKWSTKKEATPRQRVFPRIPVQFFRIHWPNLTQWCIWCERMHFHFIHIHRHIHIHTDIHNKNNPLSIYSLHFFILFLQARSSPQQNRLFVGCVLVPPSSQMQFLFSLFSVGIWSGWNAKLSTR